MIKVETRGKYAGVKIHLDPEECQILLSPLREGADLVAAGVQVKVLALKIGKRLQEKLKENPSLLEERTPEQIAAILAKEAEAARIKLDQMKRGKDWKKIDPAKLQEALNKHVKPAP